MEQNRFKSPVVWAAVVAQVVSILLAFGVIDAGIGDAVNAAAAGILQILVLFGVLNNPTTKESF